MKDELNLEQKYKKLITTKGFGHSGSGVLIDFFAEFDNTTVIGFHDKNGSQYNEKNSPNIEVDFLRRSGGVFDLEKAFECREPSSRDVAIKTFIAMSEYLYMSPSEFYDDKYLYLTKNFINNLVNFHIESNYHVLGHPHLSFKSEKKNENLEMPFIRVQNPNHIYKSYYLKDLTKKEYRAIAKEYIQKVLDTIDSKEYLIIDQFINDCDIDYTKKKEYLNFKEIAVYRDPRDVYTTGRLLNEQWIPENKEIFVKWYHYMHKNFLSLKHPDFLLIRFENFINNYEETKKKILKFSNMQQSNHIKERQYFNPDISRKNIGIYKQLQNQSIIEYIENNLKEYCYYGEI